MELIDFNYKEDFAIIDFHGTQKDIQIHPEFEGYLRSKGHLTIEEVIRTSYDGETTKDVSISVEKLIELEGWEDVGNYYVEFLEKDLTGHLFIMKNGRDIN